MWSEHEEFEAGCIYPMFFDVVLTVSLHDDGKGCCSSLSLPM